MVSIGDFHIWLILMFIGQTSALSYNQPKFCSNASWNPNAITFKDNNTVGSFPYAIFVNTNNNVYAGTHIYGQILVWLNENINSTITILANSTNLFSLFVTNTGDILIENNNSSQVEQWSLNGTVTVSAVSIVASCYGLFIDISDTLYCSTGISHQVIASPLNFSSNTTTLFGTGTCGNASDLLCAPRGIFVNTNFDLYVADAGNNRIQLFQSGESNATTVNISGVSGPITLNYPTGIVLDADEYLFIVDSYNDRILGSDINGFRCVAGCNGNGSAANQLYSPYTLSFDSYGNMFVTDTDNNRIQKFIFSTNSCEILQATSVQSSVITTTEVMTTSTQSSVITTTEVMTTSTQSSVITTTEVMTTSAQSSVITTTEIKQTTSANQTCFSPIITLIPDTSSLLSPIQFRRNEDFYISSNIQLKCENSLSTNIKWTIHNCSSICFNEIQFDQTIITTTTSEIYIPAQTLPYGTYQLNLAVSMIASARLTSTVSAYVQITASGIVANLVQLGTSMITSGYQQDLVLNPGAYSIDLDGYIFNASNWKYEYYCRIYGLYSFPNIQGLLLTIENSTMDPQNPSCLSNRTDNQTSWKYNDVSLKSSLTILGGSLQPNRTYQFMVYMENRQNRSLQATGYVLVQVENTLPKMIAIGCVISTMCVPNMEFQYVNPTTQVALFALCIGNCTTLQNITWNIYEGSINVSSNVTQWSLFNQLNQYQNIWFFGVNTSNFTATIQLFLDNPHIYLWRFEVVYSFTPETSSSALNFIINQPPVNGSCSINPFNGTTTTLFTVSCLNWFDQNGIKDYSLYIWTTNSSQRMMIAFSAISTFQVRFPAGNNSTSLLHLIISIRDTLNSIVEFNISSISVVLDSAVMTNLINNLQSSSNTITNNPIVQLLAGGNQNTVGQVIISLSQQSNQINNQNIENATSDGIPTASISISPLGSERLQGPVVSFNQSASIEFNTELNTQANVRDYLMNYTTNLLISTSSSIKLQATTLAQLTQSTNQLTRAAATLAGNKCYQLSLYLYSMATKIPYEDVQTAANQLIQCGINVLSAVNGPLQQRTNVLDLDFTRATTFPSDYDTDLESDWSNLNLFADGNDFSYETIENGRNTYYQQQLANQLINQINEMISSLTSALNIHLNIGQKSTLNTSAAFMSLETLSIQLLSNKQIQQVGNAQIHLPTLNINQNRTVLLQSIMKPLAPFGNSKSQPNTNLSTSISLSVLDREGNDVPIQTNLSNPIEIFIPRDPNLIIPPMILQNITSTPDNQLFNLQYVNITSTQTISIHFEILPLNTSLAYLFIYKFDQAPQLNSSINQIDGWTLFCPENLTNESIYTYFIDNQHTQGHQSVIFGLRELNFTEMNNFCSNNFIVNPPITNQRFNFTSNYQIRIYTSGCYYLDSNNQWQSDGLLVGPLTTHQLTQCFSTRLATFASGFIVLPAPINWNYVFANAGFLRNKTVYLTVICVCLIYIILIIYAHFNDKKDLKKLGMTPLPDNHPFDRYYYQILVFTGQRKDAGTNSNVHFILSGDHHDTQIRTFADPHRAILQRGGVDAFIMAVPKSLGLLNYIRIWHDNSGEGSSSSWYLKYLIIRDLQTMEKFHFICRRWFAVEKDDGKIERLLPIANEIEKKNFSYILSKRTYHSISNDHLWFSIFSRPPSNRFTRIQRCTCCFVLFFISMFLNIMYYDLSQDTTTANVTGLSLGPIYLSSEQVLIGVIVELFGLIPSILLVQFFRRIRTRQEKHKSRLTFPFWCLFIAYGLCVILVSLSIFFIIARSIEFGDLKTEKWLASILTGFLSSIIFIQPLRILSLAIFLAFFCRSTNDNDQEAKEYLDNNQIDFENLHSIADNTSRSPIRVNHLTENEILRAREQRLKEISMWLILREICTYFCFLILLCIITYSNQNSNSYFQVNHLKNYLFNSRNIDLDYTKITTINDYWNWLEESFVSNIHAQQWYNGDSPRNLSGFINDKTNRLIGLPTMRQLRIKSSLCSYPKLRFNCIEDYNIKNEEKDSFAPGWINETIGEYSSSILQAFQYQSSEELGTYSYESYSGNGYVYVFRGRLSDLQSNLSELHQLEWIDNYTRAVIIQMSLYNPNVELFTSATFLIELLAAGGISTTARFEPMDFYGFSSELQLICIIIYLFFIIYFMCNEIHSLYKLKLNYFRQFWSYIELGIIVCSWTNVGIYIWRYQVYQQISARFEQTNGYVFINLQLVTYVNNMYTYLLAFGCFFATIKLLHLCRFSPRLSLFNQTLENAGKALIAFGAMFSIVFFAFLCLFYFLFNSKISTCSSVLETAQMLSEMATLKFDSSDLTNSARVLGPLCFSIFIVLVVFICLSMFLSIINESFQRARKNLNDEDEVLFSFMFNKFQRWIGWKKAIEEHHDTRTECSHPIEHLSEKIDQLSEAINRIQQSQA